MGFKTADEGFSSGPWAFINGDEVDVFTNCNDRQDAACLYGDAWHTIHELKFLNTI